MIILIFVARSTLSVLAHGVDHCGAGIALFPAAANITFSSVLSLLAWDTGEDVFSVSLSRSHGHEPFRCNSADVTCLGTC